MRRSVAYLMWVGLGGLILAAGLHAGSGGARQAGADVSLMGVTDEGVRLEFTPTNRSGTLEVELYDLAGKMLAKVSRRHQGRPVEVMLYAQVKKDDLAEYYIQYRFDSNEVFKRRSLLFVGEILETTVLGQREFVAGTRPMIRVLVRDRASGMVLQGAAVEVELLHEDKVLAKYSAKTNAQGEVAAQLDMPDEVLAGVRLRVTVVSKSAKDVVEESIRIRSSLQTLLTTDKPLYQPNQTMHIRALTLSQPTMKALAEAEVIFEVEDAKGNKVFKKRATTDAFGISHVDFVLADEVNMGSYRVRAIVAGAGQEKTVTVERYVLPKFKVNLTTDRNFYMPGETVKGEIQVDYFFGKPVAGGKVAVKCSKFDVAYVDFQAIEGKTDDQGHYSFEAKLPNDFVGQPLEAGNASAKFEVSIIDTADHKETITKNIAVTAAPILVMAVPESGELIPGLDNKVYIVTTYADSTAAKCRVVWEDAPDGKAVSIETDEAGFGELTIPGGESGISMKLAARDAQGQSGTTTVQLQGRQKKGDDTVLVRTDKSLYRVGDKLAVSVLSTKKSGTVYLDVIKDRQTYLTRTLDLKDGKASTSLALDATLAGTVQVNAYLIGTGGVIVRDRKIVLVDPANDLSIEITGDSDTYLPGTEAVVKFRVTDGKGSGVASALGVMVVDEAVFALQEMQPGLEKVYFYLEKEIATPRYEVHGWEIDQCITPRPVAEGTDSGSQREKAARVLLASAKGVGEYPLHVNTYERDNKGQALDKKISERLMPVYQKIQEAFNKYGEKHKGILAKKLKAGPELSVLVDEGLLNRADTLDPWGGALKVEGQWCESCQTYHGFILKSAGIDGQWDTADDVSVPVGMAKAGQWLDGRAGGFGGNGMVRRMAVADGDLVIDAAMPMMEMAGAPAAALTRAEPTSSVEGGGGVAEPVRIRRFFPETLYFNPAVITDGGGRATLNIGLADSITTWRMTAMASSAAGRLGSTTAGLRVFQDFFVDIDFPVALTQNDKVHVPVAIYNYLKADQTIRLTVTKEDWFELDGLAEKTVTLGPSEVRAVYFPITARKIGMQTFTVTARGTSKSDAVARTVEIAPDGKEHLVSESGRLEGTITHTITIPDGAIEDASKIFVKVYPGVLSQVVEGLDSMLRMPFGCFEQTSSVTYPNILVLDYMKTSGKITPEVQMKAEGFINAGYQRLVSFEVPGGGFEWFGKAPAHRILTAYGLMQFHDMSKVHDVDPAIITRTQQWLAKCQEADGSYKPSEGGIAEGAINKFRDDVFRNTAYITWALASTGYEGPEVAKGLKYLTDHKTEIKDTYTLALAANALATADPEGKVTLEVLQALFEKRTEKEDVVYWTSPSETPTHGTGAAADIEVTALAVQAFIRCGRELGAVSKAVTYLVKNKDAFGTWQSTQATIQALRAMLMAERGATAKADATVGVSINGKAVTTLTINNDNSDVMQLVDLKEHTGKGAHKVVLEMKGVGAMLYQVVGRYYLPRRGGLVVEEPMKIDVAYDRTQLAANDIINVTATVTNNRRGSAKMVIVDLGLPPGFTLLPEKLNALVESGVIEKFSTTGRQIIIYLRQVDHGKPVVIGYQLLAKYPLKAKTPAAAAYEYYNPQVRVEAAPVELTVAQ